MIPCGFSCYETQIMAKSWQNRDRILRLKKIQLRGGHFSFHDAEPDNFLSLGINFP